MIAGRIQVDVELHQSGRTRNPLTLTLSPQGRGEGTRRPSILVLLDYYVGKTEFHIHVWRGEPGIRTRDMIECTPIRRVGLDPGASLTHESLLLRIRVVQQSSGVI